MEAKTSQYLTIHEEQINYDFFLNNKNIHFVSQYQVHPAFSAIQFITEIIFFWQQTWQYCGIVLGSYLILPPI